MSDHAEPLTADQRAHQAEAQRDILLEVLEIFTHDLSNPLQSLIVLSELALDDTPEGSEDYDRVRQSLEAAERMRTLVQGLAGLTRSIDGPRNAKTVVDRIVSVLSRRWERHQMRVSVDLGAIEHTPTPAVLQTVMLNLGLAAVAAAGDRNHPRYELSVQGASREGPLGCALEVTLVGHDAGGTAAPVPLARHQMERIERLLDGNRAVRLREDEGVATIEFAPEQRR
ncbi:MAG: HAMP domain-containing histidine kinase [Myxococcales bacterium]|nr:HAMP domain-containing histidine kinase [Myxococcales bacterium]